MFGWFKRKPKPVTREEIRAAHVDLEQRIFSAVPERCPFVQPVPNSEKVTQDNYAFVRGKHFAAIRVRVADYSKAYNLAFQIDKAVRYKKKHSHLLAELKALEVK